MKPPEQPAAPAPVRVPARMGQPGVRRRARQDAVPPQDAGEEPPVGEERVVEWGVESVLPGQALAGGVPPWGALP